MQVVAFDSASSGGTEAELNAWIIDGTAGTNSKTVPN